MQKQNLKMNYTNKTTTMKTTKKIELPSGAKEMVNDMKMMLQSAEINEVIKQLKAELKRRKQVNQNKTKTTTMNKEITPETVEKLFKNYKNHHLFIVTFGTKKFHLVSEETLKIMYDFLIKKIK